MDAHHLFSSATSRPAGERHRRGVGAFSEFSNGNASKINRIPSYIDNDALTQTHYYKKNSASLFTQNRELQYC